MRPTPRQLSLPQFKKYTENWMRPAGMEKEAVFQVWATDEGPPSHSVPPHQAAKAAARSGPEAFEKMHERLLRAYFTENRDITRFEVLGELWREMDLPEADFDRISDEDILREVIKEHEEALMIGVAGVPAVQAPGMPGLIIGAQEESFYRRMVLASQSGRSEQEK